MHKEPDGMLGYSTAFLSYPQLAYACIEQANKSAC